jgi:tRNA threonylcarbamoyladenosine biosynthesis protein TsaE
MKPLLLVTHNPEETLELGSHLGEIARAGDIYLLSGNLGVGKTCLTQGIARGLGSLEYALSPTFVLMREIHGRLHLYHIDLYRLDRIEEIADLGLDDYLYGQGICVIEWAEKGLGVLPLAHLMIKIDYSGADSVHINDRSIKIEARGNRYDKRLRELRLLLKK